MAALEARRQKDIEEEAERRRKMKEDMKKGANKPPVKKFDLNKERPNVMLSVANASAAANGLVNSMHVSSDPVYDDELEMKANGSLCSISIENMKMWSKVLKYRKV